MAIEGGYDGDGTDDTMQDIANRRLIDDMVYEAGKSSLDQEEEWKKVRAVMQLDQKRFYACDNVSEYIEKMDKEQWIDDVAAEFGNVLDALLIDTTNDPNSKGTARRLAKMYINEIMSGRYTQQPDVTSFPNNDPQDRYAGLLNIRTEIRSVCSHHHQPVRGVCFIGLIPSTHVIGLSKYSRVAQWLARRGTLQEELTRQIADKIIELTHSPDVGVYIQATHGCCENRGIMAHSSLTQTTVLHGQFYNPSVKEEWMNQIKFQLQTIDSY